MNRRERLRRCFFNEELDRPAVYSRTWYPENDSSYDELKAYLQAHSELKKFWDGTEFETSYPTDFSTEYYSEDFERRITILHTLEDDLRSSSLQGLKGQPGMPETYFLKTSEDAEKYLSLPMPKTGGNVSPFFAAKEKVADNGIVDIHLGINPAGFVSELFGSENFAIVSKTNRDVIHALCQRQMTIIINRLKFLLSKGIGPFFTMEGQELIVPPLHSPDDFDEFCVRYDKPIIDLIHDSGGRVHLHSHGSIKKVFEGFIEMGVDVLHPFEAPPMGDISAREAKELARDKLCLEGNIQINRMYEATAKQIREETEQLIQDAFDDHKGLIVSPTASPYVYGKGRECFGQYKAMVDTVLEWN